MDRPVASDNLTRDLLATYYGVGDVGGVARESTNRPNDDDDHHQQPSPRRQHPQETFEDDNKGAVSDVLDEYKENVEENTDINKSFEIQDTFSDKEIIEEVDTSSHHSENASASEDDKDDPIKETESADPANDYPGILEAPTRRNSRKFLRLRGRALPPLPGKSPIWNENFVDLSAAGLHEFPGEILDKYSGLRMLYLANNELVELPDVLFDCLRRLEWLDVRENRLTGFPTTVRGHDCLATLLLQGNRIEKLPLELGLVPNLRNVQVAQNPLIFPPQDILGLGSSAILDYLRTEWNKTHPEDPVTPNKDDSEDSSALIWYQKSPTFRKSSSLAGKLTKSHSSFVLGDVRRRAAKCYKPNSRCAIDERSIAEEQRRRFWLSQTREKLARRESSLQRIKDGNALKDWRNDRRSFRKSIEKAAQRNEGDIPFAIENYFSLLGQEAKSHKQSPSNKRKLIFTPPSDMNKKIKELVESLNQLQIATSSGNLTPRSEQKLLSKEIEKISRLQEEVGHLKKYNDVSTM